MINVINGNNAMQFEQKLEMPFFQIPKAINRDERYKGMSSDAKLLYIEMLDRSKRSYSNGLKDANGVFIYFTVAEIMEIIGVSKSTAIKVKFELESCGLIAKKKQRFSRADKIYVFLPQVEEQPTKPKQPKKDVQVEQEQKQGVELPQSEQENGEREHVETQEASSEVQKANGTVQNLDHEVQKANSNNNQSTNNKLPNNKLNNQSIKETLKPTEIKEQYKERLIDKQLATVLKIYNKGIVEHDDFTQVLDNVLSYNCENLGGYLLTSLHNHKQQAGNKVVSMQGKKQVKQQQKQPIRVEVLPPWTLERKVKEYQEAGKEMPQWMIEQYEEMKKRQEEQADQQKQNEKSQSINKNAFLKMRIQWKMEEIEEAKQSDNDEQVVELQNELAKLEKQLQE